VIEQQRIRPSAWWYAASAIPFVICIAIGVILVLNVVDAVATDMHRFVTPGETRVDLDDGDKRDIFVQTQGAVASSGFAPSASALSCHAIGPDGRVPLELADNTTLTINQDRYRSRFTFEANADGVYRVGCAAEVRPPIPVAMAVGPHIGVLQIVGSVFGVIAAFMLAFLLAGLTAGLVAFLRHRSKVKLQREASAPAWGPPGPTGGVPS
jgi:hypothetical protein